MGDKGKGDKKAPKMSKKEARRVKNAAKELKNTTVTP